MTEAKATRVEVPGRDMGGAWVQMGDKEYKVAPLNFNSIRELGDKISELQQFRADSLPSADQLSSLVPITLAGLRRNYPEMKEEEVGDLLDLGNFSAVLKAVLGASGLEKKDLDAGESKPTT